MNALGFVEVVGQVTAIAVLDSMVKCANVNFSTMENKLGGRLVTIVISGSIEDVKSAVEVAKVTANNITICAQSAIISRPHEEVMKIINKSLLKYEKK